MSFSKVTYLLVFTLKKKWRKYTMGKNLHPLFYKDTLSILRVFRVGPELLNCLKVMLYLLEHHTAHAQNQHRKGWHIREGSSKRPAESTGVRFKSLGFFPWLLVRRLTNKRQWMTARSRWLALFCLQTYVVGRTSKYTTKVLPTREAGIVHVCSKNQCST